MIQAKVFRTYLQQELISRSQRNPSYSLRAFAKSLRVDPSTLAKVLSGKRSLREKAVRSWALRLGLHETEVDKFFFPSDLNLGVGTVDFQQISLDHFAVISDWHHFAILELITVKDFKPEIKWIGRVLGLPSKEVKKAVERLVRVGLLEINEAGEWRDKSTGNTTTIKPGITNTGLRRLQRQFLEKAIDALEKCPLEKRDNTAMTLSIDIERLPEARELIKKFRREMAQFFAQGTKNEVYNLVVAFYPLSQIQTGKITKEIL